MADTQIIPVSQVTSSLSMVVEGLENQTIKPSQLKLIQNSSLGAGDTLKAGKLVDGLSGTHFDKINAVLLAVKNGRVFFPPENKVGGTPLCRSNDGIYPAANVPDKQASKCDICDHGPKLWKNYKLTGIKPDCDETMNILLIERESGFPYYLTIKGSSIKLFKQIQAAIHRDILMGRTKGNDFKIYDYTFDIVPVRVSGAKGSYFVLNFSNLLKVSNVGEYGALYDLFVKQRAEEQNDETVDALVEDEVQTEYVDA